MPLSVWVVPALAKEPGRGVVRSAPPGLGVAPVAHVSPAAAADGSLPSAGAELMKRGGFSSRIVRLDMYMSWSSSNRLTAAVFQFRTCSTPNKPAIAFCSDTGLGLISFDSPAVKGRPSTERSSNDGSATVAGSWRRTLNLLSSVCFRRVILVSLPLITNLPPPESASVRSNSQYGLRKIL